jgi:pimeloyl-ACP methyl ester carboxylesterase
MNISIQARRLLADNKGSTATILGLAAMAALNIVTAKRAERAHPPQGKFISVSGTKLHYLEKNVAEKGSGAPVILLHGNQVTAEDFELSGLLDRVAKNHHVIAFDRPGFGYSERPCGTIWSVFSQAALIHKAVLQLNLEKPVIVGHSLGAMVALAYALEYPDDTAAVLLLGGYYFPSLRADSALTFPTALPGIGDVLQYTLSPLLGRLIGPYFAKRVFSPVMVAPQFKEQAGLALRPSQVGATAADANLMGPDAARLASRYQSLTMPVTIMAGSDDKIVNVEKQAERLHAMLPQSKLELLDGTGHMLHYSYPDRIADEIEALAKKTAMPAKMIAADELE